MFTLGSQYLVKCQYSIENAMSMIRNILLVMLLFLLSFSNTIEGSRCTQVQEEVNITCFHKNCDDAGGLLVSKSKICVPEEFKWFIQSPKRKVVHVNFKQNYRN